MKRIFLYVVVSAFVNICFAQKYSKDLEKSAKAGNAYAQYQLGMAYALGNGVSRSNENAIHWMELSANQGYTLALGRLGGFYYDLGMFDKSIEWYSKQAEGGDVMAEYWLGKCYYQKENGPASIKWFKKVADRNDLAWSAVACYNIGEIYVEGKLVETNYDVALMWFKRAAMDIHAGAMTEIDKIYYYNLSNGETESEKRFWFEKLANDGYKSGFNGLGEIYFQEKKYSKAFDMFSKAIEKNNNTSVGNLGEMYYYGYHVEKNYQLAFELLNQSATDVDNPNANAMRLLSACYRYGLGTEKNEVLEQKWISEAAQHRDKKAIEILGLQ